MFYVERRGENVRRELVSNFTYEVHKRLSIELLFDERFMSEGRGDKMVQNYIMCLLDYEYHVLDNAFIVHANQCQYKKIFITEKLKKSRLY
ncbi:hypothetical protein Anas_07563 [Armadillidium nasatum]|uniref:Uncharacterized protein n=1 Tax=Armadillidium nasatum TaxID=96803 RepID=A0A5N5SRF3_9CRUS|nr:hypothetical protein Anas_07563 [Armadillidium nasatum]